jgi:tetratricopeptide (TPR) repeat protein
MSEDDDMSSGGYAVNALLAAALGTVSDNPRVDALLDRQAVLADLQIDTLKKQDTYELSHLRFRRFSDWSKFALEVAAGLVILLIVVGLGAMIWNASRDHDLVVDTFSVPGDIAQSGMTGTVLAGRVLDSFGRLQSSIGMSTVQGADSARKTGNEIRVEIPETGISVAELDQYLRQWLGSETHITGDLVRTANGYALTTRYGDLPGFTAEGPEVDALIVQSAEHMLSVARPLRYAEYLQENKRIAEALAVVQSQVDVGTPMQRAYVYSEWSNLAFDSGKLDEALRVALIGMQIDPINPGAIGWAESVYNAIGAEEPAQQLAQKNRGLYRGAEIADLEPIIVQNAPGFFTTRALRLQGDYLGAFAGNTAIRAGGNPILQSQLALQNHDFALARAAAAPLFVQASGGREIDQSGDPKEFVLEYQFLVAYAQQDWKRATELGDRIAPVVVAAVASDRGYQPYVGARLEYARAMSGDIATAEVNLAKLRFACDPCLRARARIAALKHDWSTAGHLFAVVSARSPHIPFTDEEWGRVLLAKGDIAAAAAKFESAHKKGPRYADPLEGWGEALMLQNRSDLALAKFEEANKYAPNWGRLHLKWGEALTYAGNAAAAKKQFALAATLFMTLSDKAELRRFAPL